MPSKASDPSRVIEAAIRLRIQLEKENRTLVASIQLLRNRMRRANRFLLSWALGTLVSGLGVIFYFFWAVSPVLPALVRGLL